MTNSQGHEAANLAPACQDTALAEQPLGEGTLAPAERVAQIDEQTVNLLSERLGVALTADAEKDRRDLRVLAPQREEEVLDRVLKMNRQADELLEPATVSTLYTGLMRLTRIEQLKARLARGSITADETHFLQGVTGRRAEALLEEAQLVEPAPRDSEDDLLAVSRNRIDAIDEQLMRLWTERQYQLIRQGAPGIVDVELSLMRAMEFNRELQPRLGGIELVTILEPLFISMKQRQKATYGQAREAALASLAAMATTAVDENQERQTI